MQGIDKINPYESPAVDSGTQAELPGDQRSGQWITLPIIIGVCFICWAIDPWYPWFSSALAVTEFLLMAVTATLFGLAIWGALAASDLESEPASAEFAPPGHNLLAGLALLSGYWCLVELGRGVLSRNSGVTFSEGIVGGITYLGYGLMTLTMYHTSRREHLPERWKTVLRGELFAFNSLAAVGGLALLTQLAMPTSGSVLGELWYMVILPSVTTICDLAAVAWAASVAVMGYLDRSEKRSYDWRHYLACILVPAIALTMIGWRLFYYFLWQYYSLGID